MKKYLKAIKKMVSLFIAVIININSFAAVGSNDGSAFITKAEFDAIVNTFNEQMDNYQNNLNSKIDGAIANYLAGLSTKTTAKRDILLPESIKKGVLSFNKNSPLDYVYNYPCIKGWYKRSDFPTDSSRSYVGSVFYEWNGGKALTAKKTVIEDLFESATDGESTAKWKGYYNCKDTIGCIGSERNTTNAAATNWNSSYFSLNRAGVIIDQELRGSGTTLFTIRSVDSSGAQTNSGNLHAMKINSVEHDWGNHIYPYISCVQSYDYDMFSNYERDYNYGYNGTYMTKIGGFDNNFTLAAGEKKSWDIMTNIIGATGNVKVHYQMKSNYASEAKETISSSTTASFVVNNGSSSTKYFVPLIGFERTYLKNWKQIYDGNTNYCAEFEKEKHSTETGYQNRCILKNEDDDVFIGISGGYPLMKMNKDEKLEYNLEFSDKTKNYVVWICTRPFIRDGHPDNDDKCLTNITGLSLSKNTTQGYSVPLGKGTFTTEKFNEECILYLKWGIDNSDKNKIAGGILKPEKQGTVTIED